MEEQNPKVCRPEHPRMLPPMPCEKFAKVNVLLASNSPRRRELLGFIIPAFEIVQTRDIKENYPADLTPEEVAPYLSRLKADAYADLLAHNELLITADTVVLLDGEILGKPKDHDDAVAMLVKLSGRTHTVVTGVTLRSLEGRKSDTFAVSTKVTFAEIDKADIDVYVERFRPFDKAGAYGIQEWIGAASIEGIEGSFYNVMGLPLHALYVHMKHFYD